MNPESKIKYKRIWIIFLIGFPLIWHFFIDDYVREYRERKELESYYKGIIIEKDNYHVNKLKIKTVNSIETILRPTMKLYENASIGDSIIKLRDEDSVILIQQGKRYKLQYD